MTCQKRLLRVSSPLPQQTPTTLEEAILVNEALRRENAELRAKVVALDATLRRLVRRVFSPRAETIPEIGQTVIPEVLAHATTQLKQELEAAVTPAITAVPATATAAPGVSGETAATNTTAAAPTDAPVPPATPEVVAAAIAAAGAALPAKPKAPRGRGRKTLPDHLEIVTERVTLPEEDLTQADGIPLVPVGHERAERLDWEPGRFVRKVTIRTRYGTPDTREAVITAPVPPAIVPKGLGGDDLVLHIASAKYDLGLPLYRQRRDWLRLGVDLSTQTACSWMRHLGRRLEGVTGAIRQQILDQPVLHLDDTPLKRWDPDRKGSCHLDRMWCYTAGDQVFFDFTDSRAGCWPRDLLRGYTGTIVADAYGGHDRLFDLRHGGLATEAGCWAHARRPFHEHAELPEALDLLLLIQGLYRIDDVANTIAEARASDPVRERTRLRQAQAPPILAEIRHRRDTLLAGPMTKSPMSEAAGYLRNHWQALTRFVDDGRIPLDNNLAERQQRAVAIGRKNWLFVASEDGGAWAAVLLGIFQSCRLLGLDALTYLKAIMPACIAGDVDPLELTPAAYAARRATRINAA
jgi:transposase